MSSLQNKTKVLDAPIKLYYLDLLKSLINTEDYISEDFKDIDKNTKREKLNFWKIRGSIRLISKRIKMPSEVNKEIENFIATKLPPIHEPNKTA
jgi:hypothetical protein